MTYGEECWLINKQHMHKIGIVEIRMLKWMHGKISNEHFREHLGIALRGDEMKKKKLI